MIKKYTVFPTGLIMVKQNPEKWELSLVLWKSKKFENTSGLTTARVLLDETYARFAGFRRIAQFALLIERAQPGRFQMHSQRCPSVRNSSENGSIKFRSGFFLSEDTLGLMGKPSDIPKRLKEKGLWKFSWTLMYILNLVNKKAYVCCRTSRTSYGSCPRAPSANCAQSTERTLLVKISHCSKKS